MLGLQPRVSREEPGYLSGTTSRGTSSHTVPFHSEGERRREVKSLSQFPVTQPRAGPRVKPSSWWLPLPFTAPATCTEDPAWLAHRSVLWCAARWWRPLADEAPRRAFCSTAHHPCAHTARCCPKVPGRVQGWSPAAEFAPSSVGFSQGPAGVLKSAELVSDEVWRATLAAPPAPESRLSRGPGLPDLLLGGTHLAPGAWCLERELRAWQREKDRPKPLAPREEQGELGLGQEVCPAVIGLSATGTSWDHTSTWDGQPDLSR